MPSLSATDACDRRILDAVRAIPFGQIASYGGVAERVGLTRGARRVARALAGNSDPDLPWHRVLRAGGRIAFPAGSDAHDEQARRLRDEGHVLSGSRLLTTSGTEGLDALIWRLD